MANGSAQAQATAAASSVVHQPLPVLRYSSAGQRPQDRYSAWRDGSLLRFGQRYDTTPLTPFSVETVTTTLGEIGFSHSRMTSQNWERTHAHARADDADQLMVAIRFAGAGRGDFAGQAVEAAPGSIVLSDFARPHRHFAEDASTAVLAIPRAVAERTLPRVRTLHGLVIPPAAAALLRSHAQAMLTALDDGLPAGQADRLGKVTLDLLELTVAQVHPTQPRDPGIAATGARLLAEEAIERRLASPALTIDNLCRWTQVSRATLYRLFQPDGGVAAYITARRLERARAELRDGSSQTLADLADRWGFQNPSHFSRLFRARFGHPPGAFRAVHRS